MTDTRDCACGQTAVRDEAARWFVRLQEPAMDADERQCFERWLQEHPQHADEFQLLQRMWAAADLLPAARLQALCETPSVPSKRRPLLRYAVAASVLVGALGFVLFKGTNSSGTYSADYATAFGERRQVTLPDGSVVDLNSRSLLQVRYARDLRSLELTAGEAMFSVEHDSHRPFVVDAGSGRITVTGTRFDVRRDVGETRVVVEQGTVKVQGREAAVGDFTSLTAGLAARVDAQGKVTAAYAVNPAELTAWRGGKLVFNNASLREVAGEVSRYRAKPLTVGDEKVASLRLTSVFSSDNTDALLKALPNILPVAVRTLDNGSQQIISK
ncbi:hypothetical protein PS645_03532 [Pseudomonas fluorescens]|uniref:Peptide ABC transporter substrate-binding protein n=1 Tax=Pseudomonas fluorescens TaxID=294 RepID=A0A5E6UKW3_PSEFL|nr:FecR family protein [Pseudomonas fluorescens]VVN05853.1 hypothetical protein PS645_03532 [Pseudomonas fluorescens]